MSDETEVREVSPVEAKKLADSGYVLLDVRTETEFRTAHPSGAVNVPFVLNTGAGAAGNPDFLPVMLQSFPFDRGLVVACASGVRSRRAAAVLVQAGYRTVVELPAGFEGRRSPFGELLEAGWRASGLPVSTGENEGSFGRLRAR